MIETKIIYIEPNLKDVEKFLQLTEDFSTQVINCSNSFNALQKIKERKDVSWLVIMSELAGPIQIPQLRNYVNDHKLLVKIVEVLEPENNKETNPGILQITKPFRENIVNILTPLIDSISSNKVTTQKIYSLNYLKELSQNNQTFIYKMLKTFVNSVQQKIKEMENLIAEEKEADIKQIKEIAHSLKPSFEMLENVKGKELCQGILHHFQDEEIPSAVKELKTEYNKIAEEIKKEYPNKIVS